MQSSEKKNDKPYPRKLVIEQERMYELLDALSSVPRKEFIGAFKYDTSLVHGGKRAGYIIAKLKDSEVVAFKLKFNLQATKLKRSPNFMFDTKTCPK